MAKSRRGFAAMDPDKQRQIAAKGGRMSHAGSSRNQFNANSRGRGGEDNRGR